MSFCHASEQRPVLRIEGTPVSYKTGDSLAVWPRNPFDKVEAGSMSCRSFVFKDTLVFIGMFRHFLQPVFFSFLLGCIKILKPSAGVLQGHGL